MVKIRGQSMAENRSDSARSVKSSSPWSTWDGHGALFMPPNVDQIWGSLLVTEARGSQRSVFLDYAFSSYTEPPFRMVFQASVRLRLCQAVFCTAMATRFSSWLPCKALPKRAGGPSQERSRPGGLAPTARFSCPKVWSAKSASLAG